MTNNSINDLEQTTQQANNNVDSSTGNNTTRNIFILLGALVLVGASIGAFIFCRDKNTPMSNTKETKQPVEEGKVILNELLSSLKTLDKSIADRIGSRDIVEIETSISILSSKLTLTGSLNKEIEEYTQLLQINVDESIQFSKNITDCLILPNIFFRYEKFSEKMANVFPVEKEKNIEELIKSLMTSMKGLTENGLNDIFKIMSSNFLERKNDLRDLLFKNCLFNEIAEDNEKRKKHINKMTENEVFEGFEENKSDEENLIIFYKKLGEMLDDLQLDNNNNELSDMIGDINHFFINSNHSYRNQKKIISLYLNNDKSDANKQSKIDEIFTRLYSDIEKDINMKGLQSSGLYILKELICINNPTDNFDPETTKNFFLKDNITNFNKHIDEELIEKKGENPVLDLIMDNMESCFEKVISKLQEDVGGNNEHDELIILINSSIVKMKNWGL